MENVPSTHASVFLSGSESIPQTSNQQVDEFYLETLVHRLDGTILKLSKPYVLRPYYSVNTYYSNSNVI
jgi:hypothetical protein